MNRRYIVAATFLGIAACATSGPEAPAPGATVESSAITSNPTAAEGEIEDVDVPEAPKVATNVGEANIPDQTEVVCHSVKRTGSHMSKRVCRTRAMIEEMRKDGQDVLGDLQNNQSAAESARRTGVVGN